MHTKSFYDAQGPPNVILSQNLPSGNQEIHENFAYRSAAETISNESKDATILCLLPFDPETRELEPSNLPCVRTEPQAVEEEEKFLCQET